MNSARQIKRERERDRQRQRQSKFNCKATSTARSHLRSNNNHHIVIILCLAVSQWATTRRGGCQVDPPKHTHTHTPSGEEIKTKREGNKDNGAVLTLCPASRLLAELHQHALMWQSLINCSSEKYPTPNSIVSSCCASQQWEGVLGFYTRRNSNRRTQGHLKTQTQS